MALSRSLMGKLRRFVGWPAAVRAELAQAAFLLIFARVGLRLRGFKWTRARFGYGLSTDAQAHSERLDEALTTAARVATAARYLPFEPTCLERSLTLWTMLLRRGIASRLCVGARRDAGEFTAHAWVEYAGLVLNDSADVAQDYTLLGDLSRETA